VALRPEAEQLAALTRDYKVYAKKVPGTQPGFYSVDHSAGSYVYDPQGRVRLYARYGSGASALAQDILVLLR
jgi:protein SCO1/2